jgi:integrase
MAASRRSSRSFGEGTVVERKRKSGTFYAIRFVADGERQWRNLGPAPRWTRKRAEEALRNTLTDVDRGEWVNPKQVKPEPEPVPTFHEFASEWLADQKLKGGRGGRGLSEAGSEDLEWRLSFHLLPWFADKRLDEITGRRPLPAREGAPEQGDPRRRR